MDGHLQHPFQPHGHSDRHIALLQLVQPKMKPGVVLSWLARIWLLRQQMRASSKTQLVCTAANGTIKHALCFMEHEQVSADYFASRKREVLAVDAFVD
ncbi:hypothetical protein L917_00649 [Phytophthora nicotianae]|uniref:Uncharacterized protein n=1 Tax=Phytophthora nicotianae TaxID=4792 RepID=W2M2B0_PHYNI|nr:hypothetical protein L917_00649 [Phytophthora nicotianae]